MGESIVVTKILNEMDFIGRHAELEKSRGEDCGDEQDEELMKLLESIPFAPHRPELIERLIKRYRGSRPKVHIQMDRKILARAFYTCVKLGITNNASHCLEFLTSLGIQFVIKNMGVVTEQELEEFIKIIERG